MGLQIFRKNREKSRKSELRPPENSRRKAISAPGNSRRKAISARRKEAPDRKKSAFPKIGAAVSGFFSIFTC